MLGQSFFHYRDELCNAQMFVIEGAMEAPSSTEVKVVEHLTALDAVGVDVDA